MASFLISQGRHRQRPPSEAEELKLKAGHSPAEERGTAGGGGGGVTSRLYLSKAPSGAASSLEKDAVLRRIRHHRRVNRVRAALESILGGSSVREPDDVDDDAFSSP